MLRFLLNVYYSLTSKGIKMNFMLRYLLNLSTTLLPAKELKLNLCCVTYWICLSTEWTLTNYYYQSAYWLV